MSCKETGQCRSAAACFLTGGCIETGEKWNLASDDNAAPAQPKDTTDTTKEKA